MSFTEAVSEARIAVVWGCVQAVKSKSRLGGLAQKRSDLELGAE